MKDLSMISHLCVIMLCMALCSCSSKEEVQKPKNEDRILLQGAEDAENDPDPVIQHEKQSSVTADTALNLMWSQPSPGPMYYGYIQDYCKELREGGFSDWRPATPAEIKSTMKECKEFTELPNRNGDYSLDVALGNYWHIDGCFWGLRNDEESKKDDWNAYEIIIPGKCIVENWSPCNQCQWDTCNAFCVRNASPGDIVQKTEAETQKVDLKKLQWSKNTMFDQKNYSTSLLSLTHNRYTGWNCDYGCKMRLCPDSFCSESELKKREEDAVPCGYLYRDCVNNTFGVHDAYAYCESLREGGFSDWRQPNIDELRTLIHNCDKTKLGGRCRISENRQCLNEKCWSKDCNGCGKINTLTAKTEYYELGEETKKQLLEAINDPKFSRIKSNDAFWSSTLDPENTKEAWGVDFLNARVGHMTMLVDAYDRGGAHSADFPYILDYKLKVVCVRGR